MSTREDLLAERAERAADFERHMSGVQTGSGMALSNATLAKADRARLDEIDALLADLEPEVPVDPEAPEGWALHEVIDLSDPTGWRLETGSPSNAQGRDIPENVEFTDEGLVIYGRRTGATSYTSGDARGEGHPLPNYFRVEMTGKGPFLQGLWPALLWFRPVGSSDGEIDVHEQFGERYRQVSATLHNQYGSGHDMFHGNLSWTKVPGNDPEAFHDYVIEKTPGSILVTCDGETMIHAGPNVANPVISGTPPEFGPFGWDRIFENPDIGWYPRVTMQVGGLAGTAVGDPLPDWQESRLVVSRLVAYRMA